MNCKNAFIDVCLSYFQDIASPTNGENGFHKAPPNGNGTAPVVKRRQQQQQSTEAAKTNLKNQYRCSLINLEETQDEELDAILGELSILESQFQEEINDTSSQGLNGSHSTSQKVVKQPSPVASVTSSTGESRSSPTSSETAKKPMTVNGKRTESPDTDSAFCDNLSVLSSCSTSSRYVV